MTGFVFFPFFVSLGYILISLNGYLGLRPFLMGDFFVEVTNRAFFCFQVSYCPVKRGNRAGSSRNESDYSRRGTQISFPLLESRSCENFGLLIADFSIV